MTRNALAAVLAAHGVIHLTFAGIVVNVALLAGAAWLARPRSHSLEVAS